MSNPPYPYNNLVVQDETERLWRFLCPFHKEKEPSFTVNKNEPFYLYFRCWGCGENGSAKKFARLTKQSTFPIQENRGKQEIKRPKIDWGKRVEKITNNTEYEDLNDLSVQLGIGIETLIKFSIGYYRNKWTVPMYDSSGICGIQERDINGKKKCQRYSKHGWFCSNTHYSVLQPIYICEGLTDTMVATECNLQAAGRFNALHVQSPHFYIPNHNKVYIISDTDKAGIAGSKKLQKLIPNSKILIPYGYKDLRELYLHRGKVFTKDWLKGNIYIGR